MVRNPLRSLPSVSELIENPALRQLTQRISHAAVVRNARAVVDEVRQQLRDGEDRVNEDENIPAEFSLVEMINRIAQRALEGDRPALCPVINATGVLLHTGLGRAPLAEEAVQALESVGRDYASVEMDLVSGRRSRRVDAVEDLLCELTGAEAAVVCNNNAGATMLTLAAVAGGSEVIVSRGELIEIGGSFRLPDVMHASGATLREVGTTNKTRLNDYRAAISESTGALMQVHPSNFVVVGFTQRPSLEELVSLAHEHDLPLVHDIGSGALIDFGRFGFRDEPVAAESIRRGADLVMFSGDKLLGGPQCGVIVGRASWIKQIAAHPMMRALRVDKLTLAALAATLRLYRDPETAVRRIPLLQMLSTPIEELQRRAEALCGQLAPLAAIHSATAIEDKTFLGGGSIPTQSLRTWCVALEAQDTVVDGLARRLRTGDPAVVGRIQQDRLLLDLRSVLPRQDAQIVAAVSRLGQESGNGGVAEEPPNSE
jgi:L-seryl-tRNA(Ser) seleniumtransferase